MLIELPKIHQCVHHFNIDELFLTHGGDFVVKMIDGTRHDIDCDKEEEAAELMRNLSKTINFYFAEELRCNQAPRT